MSEEIYGLDIEADYNAEDVKQAMMHWFLESHQELIKNQVKASGMSAEKLEEYSIEQVEMIVKLQFQRNKYDFNKPTKEALFYVALSLVGIAKSFRDVDVICKNLINLMRLIDKLPSESTE